MNTKRLSRRGFIKLAGAGAGAAALASCAAPPIAVPSGGQKETHLSAKSLTTTDADVPTQFVNPGEPLGYVNRLKGMDLWPPKDIQYDRSNPVATPYLVLPVATGDTGVRWIPVSQGLYSASLEILDVDAGGKPVTNPIAGTNYIVRCNASNLGATSAYGGLAEFYLASPADLDQAAITFGARLPALGYTGFIAMPGESVVIDCPKRWTPSTDSEAKSSILIHVYDPFIDPLIRPFDALRDRHVARRDILPDANSIWRSLVSKVGDEFKPDLAESWEVSDDGTTWTFHLDKFVQMPDDRPFTVDSVNTRLKTWPPVSSGNIAIKAVDDFTVQLMESAASPDLLEALSRVAFAIRK